MTKTATCMSALALALVSALVTPVARAQAADDAVDVAARVSSNAQVAWNAGGSPRVRANTSCLVVVECDCGIVSTVAPPEGAWLSLPASTRSLTIVFN